MTTEQMFSNKRNQYIVTKKKCPNETKPRNCDKECVHKTFIGDTNICMARATNITIKIVDYQEEPSKPAEIL